MWNKLTVRPFGVLLAVALVAAACGSAAETTTTAAADVAAVTEVDDVVIEDETIEDDAMEDMDDDAMEDMEAVEHGDDHADEEGNGHDHDHATGIEVDASLPIPAVEVELTETDSPGTFALTVALENFTPTPENIDDDPIDNEGHMHFLIDGERIDRFTDLEIEIDVPEGEHLVEVELNSNNHRAYTLDGEPIRAGVTVTGVGEEPEAPAVDVAIAANFANGEVQLGGDDRVEIAEGDVVMVTVTSDAAEEVHVHGYDIFADVAPDEDALITFTANIPGRFEIEFEQSGLFIAELAVS